MREPPPCTRCTPPPPAEWSRSAAPLDPSNDRPAAPPNTQGSAPEHWGRNQRPPPKRPDPTNCVSGSPSPPAYLARVRGCCSALRSRGVAAHSVSKAELLIEAARSRTNLQRSRHKRRTGPPLAGARALT
ncbi:hypothetical protein P7K49_012688 [Saguinus oedipus]|uniref:Uncharacterized protein n=1 Tax=Saguinus oedipus TaxID=9490 RepID=A0ABQ9VDS1_SAGOE|nr:hypothetical protein P7K49_012688 [Saguinus oedipus]